MPASQARRSRPILWPIYSTALLVSVASLSLFAQRIYLGRNSPSALTRGSDAPMCRSVHSAADQCAFVVENCVQETAAGLLPYLRLFYCDLAWAKPVAFGVLVAWLGVLFSTIGLAASDFFTVNLSTISSILGLSESLAGVTFLAFGNGAPDLFSTFAAMGSNSASMAVGELIGAAGFITAVVAGSMALVCDIRVERKIYVRDICFFTVAVALTVGFLADGYLHLWGCILMICFYFAYVSTVGWQWISAKGIKDRQRSVVGCGVEIHAPDYQSSYHRQIPATVTSSPTLSGQCSPQRDTSSPRIGPTIDIDCEGAEHDEEEQEEGERIIAAGLASNMRVIRPRGRRSSARPAIRPSLIGALEFRAALAHSQQSIQPHPRSPFRRSYSDPMTEFDAAVSGFYAAPAGQSASDAVALDATKSRPVRSRTRTNTAPSSLARHGPMAPNHALSFKIGGNLAPPPRIQVGLLHRHEETQCDVLATRPKLTTSSTSPHSHGPPLSPSSSKFPALPSEDSPLLLESAAAYDTITPVIDMGTYWEVIRSGRQWLHSILSPMDIVWTTLFPTLRNWRDNSVWGQFLSIISIPSVLLLVITLPVVDESQIADPDDPMWFRSESIDRTDGHTKFYPVRNQDREEDEDSYGPHSFSGRSPSRSPALISVDPIDTTRTDYGNPRPIQVITAPGHEHFTAESDLLAAETDLVTADGDGETTEWNQEWNRWLVAVQLFAGPQFLAFVLWANLASRFESAGTMLIQMAGWTLIGSAVLITAFLLTTRVSKRPTHHYLLSFLGFIVSIAWISTIAGEVVGALKAFGVILNVSEAILGLTVFAAGNSIGDLVANITMAKLGHPVMALSACFGGPMLNILLGIGIGGTWMMIKQANRRHQEHPDREMLYKPFRVQVGGTLLVSAVTLLLTLLALLVLVPMNRWTLCRRVGLGLIALWSVSTALNVVLEVTGKLT